jgi:calcium/proton exchanger cax
VANPSILKEFITLIVVTLLSNAPEHVMSVVVTRDDKFNPAVNMGIASGIQIALSVTLFLVLIMWCGQANDVVRLAGAWYIFPSLLGI